MQLIITGKNLDLSERMKEYVEEKIGKLDHYMPSLTEARVELSKEKTKSAAQRQVVQVTLRANGALLRGEERSSDVRTAVDAVLVKLHKQIERYKTKHYHHRGKNERVTMPMAEEEELNLPRIVRRKRFQAQPMTENDALEQMELLGHNFFLFINDTSGALSLIYRRNDGNYGLIEPETE